MSSVFDDDDDGKLRISHGFKDVNARNVEKF